MEIESQVEQVDIGDTEGKASQNGKVASENTAKAIETVQKKDKFTLAKSKLEEARKSIAQTDEEIETCLQKIDEDLAAFTQAHERLKHETIEPTRTLMAELGVDDRVMDTLNTPPVVEADDPSIAPVEVPAISKGIVKSLLIASGGVLVALGGWCYAATQALGLPLLPKKIPDLDRLNRAFAWTAQQFGQGENVAVGSALVLGGTLVIGGLLFGLSRLLRDSKNVRVAQKVEEESAFYCSKKGECKQQMEKIREHIAHAQKTVEMYTVLLDELKARLARARFIEEADTFGALHAKTQKDIETTNRLIAEVTEFLKTPMAQSGVLNKEGIDALEKATGEANKYVMGLYA